MAANGSKPPSTPTNPFDDDLEMGNLGTRSPESTFDAAPTAVNSAQCSIRAKEETEGTSEEESDPNIVTWDGPNDPMNPMNWTDRKKWMNIAVLSIMTVVT